MSTKVEYQVRPVTRYVVTRYTESTDQYSKCGASSEVYGEFDNAHSANKVVVAMANSEGSDVRATCHTFDEDE